MSNIAPPISNITDFYITGDYVLSKLFSLPFTGHIDIYALHDSYIHPNHLRQIFNLSPRENISIYNSHQKFVFNADYWVFLPNDNDIKSLNHKYPVTDEIFSLGSLKPTEAIRFISLLTKFPWKEFHPSLKSAIDISIDLYQKDPELADLISEKYADCNTLTLLNIARSY